MRRRSTTAAIVAALSLAGMLSAGAGVATTRAVATARISWHRCQDSVLSSAGAQCGSLRVPLDYSHPHGRQITLAVSRVVHTSARYQGVMLVNPGGPGSPGIEQATLGSYVPGGVGDDYDWVGFDPRGVGDSRPQLTCKPHYFGYDRPDYRPTNRHLLTTWLDRSRSYARACGKKYGGLLAHMTSTDTVRDMDEIRKALGVSAISYYGFSYGTYLGQIYATMFPHRIKRMVLDSNVDPARVWYHANLAQDVGFDRNVNLWFGWLAKYDGVYHLGSTRDAVRTLWYRQLARLAKHPAGGKIGPDEWTDIFVQAGYYQDLWDRLGTAFSGWVHAHRWRALKTEYDAVQMPGNDNQFAVYSAVQCSDAPWPTTWSRWQKDNNRLYAKAPFETWANAWFNAPCLYWPVKPARRVTINGRQVRSALLIDETRDAATPFSGSLAVRKLFPRSSLIAVTGGTTHAGSLSGNACVDDQVANYLASGHRPPRRSGTGPDATCAPDPGPAP